MANIGTALPFDARWKMASELPGLESKKKSDTLLIPALKQLLINGLERGIVAEISGARSTGKSALYLHILAQATRRGEVCAVVDLHNSFHPHSAAACGVLLDRVLWVRCNSKVDHTIRTADLVLHAGGFGLVLVDLSEADPKILNKIPVSYWYRFRRAIENTPTILLICSDTPQVKSAGNHSLKCRTTASMWSGKTPFARLNGLNVTVSRSKVTIIRPVDLQFFTAA